MAVLLFDPEFRDTDPAAEGDLAYDVIEFDAVVEIVHSSQSQVTRHPVESGQDLSDHSIPQPREVQLNDAVISNFPLLLPGEDLANDIASGKSYDIDDLGSLGEDLIAVDALAETAYQKLETWRTEGRALSLVDDFESYDNVLIESVSVPRRAGNGNAMIAQIRLIAVDIAESQLIDLSQSEEASALGSQGPKAKDVATEAEGTEAETSLRTLLGIAG